MLLAGEEDLTGFFLEPAKSTCAFGEDAWNVPMFLDPSRAGHVFFNRILKVCIPWKVTLQLFASQRATFKTERASSPERTGIKTQRTL
jgi:hypothetical protein